MMIDSLWQPISTTLTNVYYVYYSASDLVTFPRKIDRVFSVIDIINCLDFFCAIDRLKTAVLETKTAKTCALKVHALSQAIQEAAGMFSDVYWIVDELKSFTLLPQNTWAWAKPIYTVISPLQYLWLKDSIYKTYQIRDTKNQFFNIYKRTSATDSLQDRTENVQRTCKYVLDNYKNFKKNFNVSKKLKDKVENAMLQTNPEQGEQLLNKLQTSIRRIYCLDLITSGNNVIYYSLSVVAFFGKNPIVSVCMLACCIASLALGIFNCVA